jgi:hypothetical protein
MEAEVTRRTGLDEPLLERAADEAQAGARQAGEHEVISIMPYGRKHAPQHALR